MQGSSLIITLRYFSPFFFVQVGAKKNQKTPMDQFRLCGGDLGRCPKTLVAF